MDSELRPAPEQSAPKPTSVPVRTVIGAGLVALLGVLLAVDSVWPAGFVYAAAGMAAVALAMDEFARLARRIGADVSPRLLVLGGVALFAAQWAGWVSQATPDPWLLGAAMLGLVVMAAFADRIVQGRIEGALMAVCVTAGGLVYVALLMGFLTAVRVQFGVAGVVTCIVVCKSGSSGAYFVGTALGRTKLAPKISPGKTWAGAVGAAVGSVLVACAMSRTPWALMGSGAAVLYGLLMAVVGIVGDLAASLLKMEAGVKDSGRLVRGSGGMLDIVDDVLFAAPLSFLFFLACA